jgi:hypothetical protein
MKILKAVTDTSPLDKVLDQIKSNPHACEVVRKMVRQDRFKELFAMRTELVVEAGESILMLYAEPTPLLKALGAAVLN